MDLTPEEFINQYQCKFVIDDQRKKLLDRVEQYFRDTENCGFHVGIQETKKLKKWCSENGYSKEDLISAKRTIEHYLKI